MVSSDAFLPANFAETYLDEQKILLKSGFSTDKLSHIYDYALFDIDNKLIETNMNNKDIAVAEKIIQGHYKSSEIDIRKIHFSYINIDNNKLVLSYKLKTHYSNQKLDAILPPWDILLMVAVLILVLLYCYFVAKSISKMIKKNMQPIIKSTKIISDGELNFEVSESQIDRKSVM